MKKQIIVTVSAILLMVVLVTAVTIANRNTEVSKPYKTALESINLSTYEYTDYEQDGLYQRCLHKKDAINTCSGWIDENQLNDWETQRIEGIANATIERQNRGVVTKETEGAVTVTEKK